MLEFLDEAYRLRRYTSVALDRESFDLVFSAINELQAVYAKSTLELRNVEAVFAAFEMAQLFRKLGSLSGERISLLGDAIRKVIVETLEATLEFEYLSGGVQPPTAYTSFANHLSRLIHKADTDVAVITFNYDFALDLAMQRSGLNPVYCLAGDVPADSVPLLKLHGSLTWWRCAKCQAIDSAALDNVKTDRAANNPSRVHVHFTHNLAGDHCPGTAREIAIVPPTWNKTQYYAYIAKVWQVAAQKLSQAENIIIMGYSLPQTDQFFKYLFALGTIGPARLQRLWVYNPDPSVDRSYLELLGPLAKDRYRLFSGEKGLFSRAIKHLDNKLVDHDPSD